MEVYSEDSAHGLIASLYSAATNPGQSVERVWSEIGARHTSLLTTLKGHYRRAKRLSQRIPPEGSGVGVAEFVLDGADRVRTANGLAQSAFCIKPGDSVESLPLDASDLRRLRVVLDQLRADPLLFSNYQRCARRGQRAPVVLLLSKDVSGDIRVTTPDLYWSPPTQQLFAQFNKLTDAELAVVKLLVEGCSVKEAAQVRGASVLTVRSQVRSIYEKTGAPNQPELIRMVMGMSIHARSYPQICGCQPEEIE